MYSTCPRTTHQPGGAHFTEAYFCVISLYIDRSLHAVLSLTVTTEYGFSIKLLKQRNCDTVPESYGPEPKEYDEEVRGETGRFSALLLKGPSVVAASVGIIHGTTQNIIHKGPVCRQQAEPGRYILLVGNTDKPSLSGATQRDMKNCCRSLKKNAFQCFNNVIRPSISI